MTVSLLPMSPLLGFWTLASGWMLLWGLAGVLPLLIHLLSRRTRSATNWAAMEFLYAAVRKNARRLRLEQWLLLAVRTLAVLLVALAWADPTASWLPSRMPAARTAGQTHTLIVLDGSYSMLATSGGQRRWDRAQQLARQLVAQGVPGDGFSVLLMANPPRAVVADVAFDRTDVQQEISNLGPTQGGATLVATLSEAERIVREVSIRNPRLEHHRVCFFTDLGRNTWQEALSPECSRRTRELASRASLVLINVADQDLANVAVANLSSGSEGGVVGDRVSFEVALESMGSNAAGSARVELLVDDNRVAERKVNLVAEGRTAVTFSHVWESAGEHVVTARVGSDALELDNSRFLSSPVRAAWHVLCVEGEQDAAKYLALALSPETDGHGRIRVERAAESSLVERKLSDFDCVWLCNVGRFGREETNLLYRYVASGGALVIAPGDQTQPDNYNRELGGEASGKRLLPAKLETLMGSHPYRFDPADYSHPILDPFRGHERSGLLTAPTWRFFQLKPHGSSAKVALRFQGDSPAIVEETIGRGVCVLLATSVSLSSSDPATQPPTLWTALPSWPSFPPLVHAITQFAVRGRQQSRNLTVGQSIVMTELPDVPLDFVTVSAPDEPAARTPVRSEAANRTCVFTDTEKTGIYRAQFGEDSGSTQLFAVNLDTGESDLSRFDPERLPSQWRESPPEETGNHTGPAPREHWPLFRILLMCVLALLLSETVLAWKLGGSPG